MRQICMKAFGFVAVVLAMSTMDVCAGVVSAVKVSNRYPWNGLVDIRFNLSQDAAVTLTAIDTVGKTNLLMKSLSESGIVFRSGQTTLPAGDRHVVWNAAVDYPNCLFEDIQISVATDEKLYMVVDLTKSGGKFPVTYLAGVPKSGWPIEYKTKYLVLRKIKAGSFTMGSPTSEWGRNSNESQSKQTIAKDYYIGIYEVSYGQLYKVTGANPSSYGWSADYPANVQGNYSSRNYVEKDFLSALTSGAGLSFKLPSEAQWEYACRAGTTTTLYTGANPKSKYEVRIELAGRENFNNGGSADAQIETSDGGLYPVGVLLPNPWGLYDMYGNRGELCDGDVCKGGSHKSEDTTVRSAYKGSGTPSNYSSDRLGFRVVAIP